ncbi:MAG TPA: PAS domain-containing sensor histidine kinase, partial [Sedimenticola sp.]|nr:PAS domain-containing sensor histidine kinase [Sedimenticola sp.]
RLDQQARETLIRFDNYVAAHISTARLLANHRRLSSYLEPVYWYDSDRTPPIIYYENPPWLPDAELWQALIQPSQVLLVDRRGRTREIYNAGGRPLPGELLKLDELFLRESRVQSLLTTLQGQPYLLVSEQAEDATGTNMGSLMLVVPIDQQFLIASQQGVTGGGVVVGLMDADEQRFLTTSDQVKVPPGSTLHEASRNYLVTAQSFFRYEGFDLNLQFATLVPRESVEATRLRVAAVERRQRVVAAVAFISVFTLVFYLLSERLNRTLRRISRFSRRALGGSQPVMEKGNQIFVLEDWIRQFMRQVLKAREEMSLRHESEMRESEALKQAIMEAALDAIITIDQTERIVEFNSTAERMFGHQRDQVIGQDFLELIIEPKQHGLFQRTLEQFVREREGEGQEARQEMEAVRADGSAFPVEVAIKPIRLRDRLLFTVYVHDISDRKRAQEQISSLAKFPSESPSPILRVNQRGVIMYANSASAPLLEYWGVEQGQTLPLYWRNRLKAVFDYGHDWETEVACDGRIYSLLAAPVVDRDYVNIYGRDITAVRQAEREAREHQQELVHVCRLSTMGEMATGLAHELNQPLSAIANFANGCTRRLQSSLSGGGSEDLLYALGQINNQADRAGEIIRRLRSLVGKQPPVRSVANINDLVREVCSFVEFDARKGGVVIEQELPLARFMVRVDVVQIEQVLLNLIRNALDALLEVPPGERTLVVRTRRLKNGNIVVEVEDTGPGIDPDAREHLFEPFFTTKKSGMGMGLVISRTIVEGHKGRIEARALPGRGSLFTVTLPGYRKPEDEER